MVFPGTPKPVQLSSLAAGQGSVALSSVLNGEPWARCGYSRVEGIAFQSAVGQLPQQRGAECPWDARSPIRDVFMEEVAFEFW